MKIKRRIYFSVALCLLFLPGMVSAYEIRVETENTLVHGGDQFLVNVFLNASEEFNAVDGRVSFDPMAFEATKVYEGNSAVNFWLEPPRVSGEGNIIFALMTPGGFQGNNEKLFSVEFTAKEVGVHPITVLDAHLFKNDGTGTPSSVDMRGLGLNVLEENLSPVKLALKDTEPPEDFTPIVTSDPNLFEGKNFLIFDTQDKGLGIDHAEVREGVLGFYKQAISPYLLSRQNVDRPIYLRVIDKAGNVREVIVPPRINIPIWKQGEWIALFVVAMLFLQFLRLSMQYKLLNRMRGILRRIKR